MARKQHKFHYIYKTTCTVTGRYYVGMHSTSNLDDDYIGSGKRLWYSINKHGRENHEREILEMLPDRSSLKARERELVNESLIQDEMCMNLMKGGHGGSQKLETQEKWRKAGNLTVKKRFLEDDDFRKGWSIRAKENWKKRSYREKMKISHKGFLGKTHTEEFKKMIGLVNSKKQIGEKNSQYGTHWITNGEKNLKIKKGDKIPKGWKMGRKIF